MDISEFLKENCMIITIILIIIIIIVSYKWQQCNNEIKKIAEQLVMAQNENRIIHEIHA